MVYVAPFIMKAYVDNIFSCNLEEYVKTGADGYMISVNTIKETKLDEFLS